MWTPEPARMPPPATRFTRCEPQLGTPQSSEAVA